MKLFGYLILFFSVMFLSGCSHEKSGDNLKKISEQKSELIREKGTEVALLDKNKDGMVYQCPMDFQVVADSIASCPVCKMDLEEFSVAEAQKNLESHYH